MADIKIYGVLVNDTSEGIVTRSDQVFDKNFGKTQASINEELMDIANSVKDLTITYDDFVTETSKNAVKSSGVFKAIKDVSDHLPFIGSDGYVYVWDPALNDYKRSGTNLTGPAGETGGGIHLIFDAIVLTVDEFGVMSPSSPLRVRAIRQYGQTGLDEFTEGRIRWWYNDIEDENKPDGESPVDENGNGVSEVFIDIDPDHHEKVTVRLYLDQAATKLYDQQDVVILRHPTIYKLDLTNENSMVPMEDDEGNVKDEFLETTQAILYYGASQIPFNEIKYSIGENDHDGITTATIDEEGIVTLKGWKTAWSNVSIKITAEYKGHVFYATYTIARVSGVAIYRLKPSVTGIKKKKDGTFNTDKLYVNVMKVVGSNTGSMTEKVLDLAAEKLSVRYTYNNKVNSNSDIYTIDDIVNEGIPIKDEELPETLDGSLVSEVDVYLVKSGQALEDLDTFIDHETVPLVEDGDDGFNLMLTNENMTIAALADGTQVGQLMNTQGLLYKGIQNLSEKAKWTYKILSGSIKGSPRWHATIPGYLNLAGCEVDKNSDEVEIAVYAQYPSGTGETFQKTCTITKAKQGATGEAGYKSIIFCRTNMVPDTPLNGTTGGTYEKPVPTHDVTSNGENLGIKWHDGIPDGKEKIWSSSRYFSTYSIEGQKATTWTVPTVMSDTENMNIEFTWYDPYIGDPDSDPDFWFDPDKDKDAEVFQSHTMIYMATQRLENGVPVTHTNADGNETSWTIVRVLGEKGETALRSFVFTRCFDKPATPVGGTIENPIPDPEQGDGTVWYDGIPGGDTLLPVWGSLRTFSSIKHLETEWSEPQIMKDVPNEYDVQYSIKRERPDPPSDDYPSSGADWFDPEDPTATPEIMAQVMWMAQRWYSSDGWSPWDIIKVKGEDGKDGSKAIPRMRGDWKDDITYDSWILSGESHVQIDEESGETVEVLEAYQDLVYYKNNEVQECYKCLKSHKKNDAYNPGTATYSWDQKKQADISSDGIWMKAVNYEFLSTRLLNAEQIIADVVAARKTEIFGQAPGKWKGTDNNVYTRVVTESGKIEFEYKLNDDGSEGGWTPLITFGYDPNVGGGVLKFYRDGKALYDLGPTGLSASEVNSPYYETKPYYETAYASDSYQCYGVYFCDAENEEVYDSASGTIKDFYLNKKAGREYYIKDAIRTTWKDEKEFTYKNLKTGSFIPQMTLPFDVISPIPMYDPVTDTTVTGAEVIFEGDPVGYPSSSNPIITFGQKTIGFMALRHPDVKYHSIDFSWASANLDRSLGVLTYPIRKWTCVSEKLTSLYEIDTINEYGTFDYELGKTFNPYCRGNNYFPFTARIDSVDTSMGTRYLCHLLLADGSNGTTVKSASSLFKAFIDEYDYGSADVERILDSGYVKLEQIGSDSPLLSSTICVNIIKEAIEIVSRTISNLINLTASGPSGFNITLEPNSSNGHVLSRGLHRSFYNAVQEYNSIGGTNKITYRTSFYLAKNILNNMIKGGYDITNKHIVGYIFPEDQYFAYEDEDDFDYKNNRLKIVKLGSGESIFESQPFSGYKDAYIPSGKNYSHFGTYLGMPVEDKEKHRAYLMIDAASGTKGSVSNSSSGTGNTYEISIEIDHTSDNQADAVMTIKYKAVPKISAYLDKGMNYMIWSSGYSSWRWTNNYYINDVLDSTI